MNALSSCTAAFAAAAAAVHATPAGEVAALVRMWLNEPMWLKIF